MKKKLEIPDIIGEQRERTAEDIKIFSDFFKERRKKLLEILETPKKRASKKTIVKP